MPLNVELWSGIIRDAVKTWRVVCIALLLLSSARAAEIRGTVVNARGGEPLGQVRVWLAESGATVVTSKDGSFSLTNISPGTYTLRVEAVGFWLQKVRLQITDATEIKEYTIALSSEGMRRTETVEVKGDIFRGVEPAGIGQMSITAGELNATATLAASDPFRTVQVMPGVTAASNNDLYAEFTVLGSPIETVGIYVDDVQLRSPFHGIPTFADGASTSVLSSDTLESLTLTPTAYSERYEDSTGGALDIRTREGSRERQFRVALGLLETHGSAEGGIGDRGSWLVSLRKSYMGYLIRATGYSNVPSVGFYDGSTKWTYDLNNKHHLDLYALDGSVSLDRTREHDADLGPRSTAFGRNVISLARAGWRYAVRPNLLLNSRAAFIREKLKTETLTRNPLDQTYYGEWVGGTTAVWSWKPQHILEVGYDLRRIRDNFRDTSFETDPLMQITQITRSEDATALRQGGYVQQTSSLARKRVQVMAGLRWDHLSYAGPQLSSPQASASVRVGPATELQFGTGRYLQFAEIAGFGRAFSSAPGFPPDGACALESLTLNRSTHYLAAIEHRLGEHSRVRVEAFQREQHAEAGRRTSCDAPFEPFNPGFEQKQRARGMQFIVQRRSANRLAGWIGYTLNYVRDTVHASDRPQGASILQGTFRSLFDQRHTLNAFGAYRLKPSVSLSGKWMYGSGYPVSLPTPIIPGSPPELVFADMPAYARLDVRMDKTFALKQRKLTLSLEVINATNHHNMRFIGFRPDPADPSRMVFDLDRTLPILPSAGLSFEF